MSECVLTTLGTRSRLASMFSFAFLYLAFDSYNLASAGLAGAHFNPPGTC